jgi:hypothetical protein
MHSFISDFETLSTNNDNEGGLEVKTYSLHFDSDGAIPRGGATTSLSRAEARHLP